MIHCKVTEDDKAILTKEQIEKKIDYYGKLADRHRFQTRKMYYLGQKHAYMDILANFYNEEE